MVRAVRRVWLPLLLLAACADAPGSRPAPAAFPLPEGQWRQVVPGPGLPAAVTTHASNNNLDIALFEGSLFFAFRTSRTHFAGPDTYMHILRSDDPEHFGNWVHETTIALARDVREPRFFVHDGRLFFYYAVLGTELVSFEPGGVEGMVRGPDGRWSDARTVFDDGTIAWRTKRRDGRVYMTAYRGGENLYQARDRGEVLEVLFLTTDDGWTWRGVDPDRPVVLRGGVSETEVEFGHDGFLYTVSRNEAGDETGFGSRLCRAAQADPANWQCNPHSDPHKYDSPLLFRYREYIYLVARYNPAGPFDTEPGRPATLARWWRNTWDYSATPKRTALYGYDTTGMRILPLSLFPSNGDTAFASAEWLDERRLLIFNYSSDPEAPDMAWIEGQFAGANIYAAVLEFPD